MSYSFSIRVDSKDEAGIAVDDQLDEIVASQPIHNQDRQETQDAVEAFIELLRDPEENEEITITVSGSVVAGADKEITSASVNISVAISTKEAADTGVEDESEESEA